MTAQAWFCPACQRHHAPHVDTCPGSAAKTVLGPFPPGVVRVSPVASPIDPQPIPYFDYRPNTGNPAPDPNQTVSKD